MTLMTVSFLDAQAESLLASDFDGQVTELAIQLP